jgi:hypothetical protein
VTRVPAAHASDGVDELLTGFAPWRRTDPSVLAHFLDRVHVRR